MAGNFKLGILIITIMVMTSCRNGKQTTDFEGKEMVKSNMPVLLDSLEAFNWTKIPLPKEFKKNPDEKYKVELIDSIVYEKNIFDLFNSKFSKRFTDNPKFNFKTFKLDSTFLPSDQLREIELKKESSNSIYTLTVTFSNLLISDSNKNASIVVTKRIGISAKKDIYYFENLNGKWTYIGRDTIYIG